MIKEPFFTIIITTYNRLNYLKESVESVLNQTFDSWNLHIVDNSSTDGTNEYLKSLLNDKRIKFSIINNKGIIAKSRNYGLRKAKSKAVCFLDDDDIWLPNKLNLDYKLLTSGNEIVYSRTLTFKDNFKNFKNLPVRKLSNNGNRDILHYGNTFVTSSVSYLLTKQSKEVFFNESNLFVTWEDYDLWVRLLEKGLKPVLNDKKTVLYRISNSQNTFPEREIKNIKLITQYHKNLYLKYKIRTINNLPIWAYYSIVIDLTLLGKPKKAINSIILMFKTISSFNDLIYYFKLILKFFILLFFSLKKSQSFA